MHLDRLDDNPFGTNCWIVAADGSEDALIVDPGFFADRILQAVRDAGKRPVAVLATHGHGDHIGQAAAVGATGIPVHIHEADALVFDDAAAWGSGFPMQPDRPADLRTFVDGDVLQYAGFALQVLHTPGHTPGSVCFVTDGFVFSGDLVFQGTIGRSDLPNSSPEDMEKSLVRFLELPDELDVYPGHMGSTTVGRERVLNPFLAALS